MRSCSNRCLLLTVVVAVWLVACGPQTPASLEFVDVTPAQPKIGDIATVRFKATDSRGEPMAGVGVDFSLRPELTTGGGVTLTPATGLTNKTDGIVSVQLQVNSRISTVVVVAKAGEKTAFSPSISFAGAIPSARQFTFQCGPLSGQASGGVHAISAYDETRHLIAGVKLNCTAHLGDRNGDGVVGALVSFLTEAGTIGPTQTSVSDVIGNATIQYKTSKPLPKDVAPGVFSFSPPFDATHTGELLAPLWMHPFLWQANPVVGNSQPAPLPANLQEPRRTDPVRPGLTLNPRDNLVSMIAVTNGEEAFDDANNNGKYDNGEVFEDLTEPFVDDNDNGTWDADERWVDANGNGRWDGKNGQHDEGTLIWVQERILWTGIPHALDVADPTARVFAQIRPTAPVAVGHFLSERVTFLIADPWFNTMAQNGDDDGCETVPPSDKPLVTMLPGKAAGGRRLTYPSHLLVDFTIKDAHAPDANLDGGNTKFNPPAAFSAPIFCSYTATPEDGHKVTLTVTSISGTVE